MDESDPKNLIRPQDLQAKYNISQTTYYKRLRYLEITSQKDSQRKAYITPEQVTQLDQLHSHIQKHKTMIGFKPSPEVSKNTQKSQESPIYNTIVNFPKAPRLTAIAP
ncbi:hypothetical protein PCC7424_4897 [Gloeothece citriformis PCC 7424]|uniref:Uncharacterized protein n=1 Tax=Gloeothece citriformis (strain PCC 7424) TaxID=65393 RepID=B7KED6_GLOC7|nr:hypothetical protein [Gloeothece citriformis]ACK73254.1 hypothetical protein PCC7424_4897 [Gloeothece citriformis PCC 7424]